MNDEPIVPITHPTNEAHVEPTKPPQIRRSQSNGEVYVRVLGGWIAFYPKPRKSFLQPSLN